MSDIDDREPQYNEEAPKHICLTGILVFMGLCGVIFSSTEIAMFLINLITK